MKKNEKKELEAKLSQINRTTHKLISECHSPGCEMIKHPLMCCPQCCDIMNVHKYTIALGAKVMIKIVPSADSFAYHWPQVVWQLRLMALELAGGKNFDSHSYTEMKALFFDLIDFAKLYASNDIRSEIASISRTFTKILDV